MLKKRKMQASTLILVIFLTLAVVVTGIIVAVSMVRSSKGDQANKADETELSGTDTLVSDGSIGDGFAVDAAYDSECSGPLFAYSQSQNALLAYCHADSTHTPYDLTENADTTGKVNEFYFTEFDLTVYYRLDTDANIWRIYKADPESKEANGALSLGEYIIYNDADDILSYAPHLRRFDEDAYLKTPEYRIGEDSYFYQAEAVLHDTDGDGTTDYVTSGGIELSLDMDGNGLDEVFTVALDGTVYKIKMNGVDILTENNLIFFGMDIIDINKEDTYREMVCVFKDIFGFTSKSIVIRFADGAVNTLETRSVLYTAGNKKITVLSNDVFLDSPALYEYSVTQTFLATISGKTYETDRNLTAIKEVGVKYVTDGVYTNGFLEAGAQINVYKVDYDSKAYFRMDDGREGVLEVEGNYVGSDPMYFYRCFEE